MQSLIPWGYSKAPSVLSFPYAKRQEILRRSSQMLRQTSTSAMSMCWPSRARWPENS